MTSKDYYKTLGVERDASQQQIASAFKKLAREHHPDLNKDPQAVDKFKEVSEAYEVLKDPESRQQYDAMGSGFRAGAGPGAAAPGGVHVEYGNAADFADIFSAFGGRGFAGAGVGARRASSFDFEDLFGRGGAGDDGVGSRRQRGPMKRDVLSELTVDLEDVAQGRTRTIKMRGSGKRYDVKIPRGVRSGERIRLAGQGEHGGDLYITINVAPHARFSQEGDDLVVKLPVTPWDAALGSKAQVNTLRGEVTLSVPAGVSSGQRLRLRGKGLPRKGGGSGDLFAEVQITLPGDLSDEQKRLFEKLREVSRSKRARA